MPTAICPKCGRLVTYSNYVAMKSAPVECIDCWNIFVPVEVPIIPPNPVVGETDGGTGILLFDVGPGVISMPEYRKMLDADILGELKGHLDGGHATNQHLDRYVREPFSGRVAAILNERYNCWRLGAWPRRNRLDWWRRLMWFLFSRDYCPRCRRVTRWDHKLLYNAKEDTHHYGESCICRGCRIEVLSTDDMPVPTYGEVPDWRYDQ
jgi:hypothetical protein